MMSKWLKALIYLGLILGLGSWVNKPVWALEPANPNVSLPARNILNYFDDLPNKSSDRVVSGQEVVTGNDFSSKYSQYIDEIERRTGEKIAIMGVDLNDYIQFTSQNYYQTIKQHWDSGGLVTVSSHFNNPWGGSAWDKDLQGGKLSDLYTPGSSMYQKWRNVLDQKAQWFSQLQDAGVVVLWRPFHEMNGYWFWWGNSDREQFLGLWQDMFNYFTNVKHLNNLLWVYAPNRYYSSSSVKAADYYYPGNNYVDIVGLDFYKDSNSLSNISNEGYATLTQLGKPFALTEFGPRTAGQSEPDPNSYDYSKLINDIKSYAPRTVYFLPWTSPFALINQNNVSGLLNDSWVVNRGELPDFNIQPTPTPIPTPTPALVEYGIASNYPGDNGIKSNPAVLFASGFESKYWLRDDFNPEAAAYYPDYQNDPHRGRQITDSSKAYSGNGVLEYQNIAGTHYPQVYRIRNFSEDGPLFVRWYRKWEAGYDLSCVNKMHAIEAIIQNAPAGYKPTGDDFFSCMLDVSSDGEDITWRTPNEPRKLAPKFYCYHPDQPGTNPNSYGQVFSQNVVADPSKTILESAARVRPDKWFAFEFMLKPNDPSKRDGEIKMWVDGVLKAHHTGLRFRDVPELKFNEFILYAYIGGSCTAPKNQKIWDDNVVLAKQYIGPMVTGSMPMPTPNTCLADLNQDNNVSASDLLMLLADWGNTNSKSDINQDGRVEVSDILLLLNSWGICS